MPPTHIFLLLLLPAAGLTAQTPLASIPFDLQKNLVYFELSVNGSEPLHFLFDTGAGVTVIDHRAARLLGLKVSGSGQIATSGRKVEAQTSTGNTLDLDAARLENVTLEIIPLDHLSGYLNHPVDGVIGFDLMQAFVVETHIDSLQMRLYDPNAFAFEDRDNPIDLIPLGFNHFGIPLTLQLDRRSEPVTLPFDLDTAFEDYLVVHNHTLKQYNLLQGDRYREVQGFGAESTLTTNYRAKLRRVTFGGLSWKNVSVVFEVDPISVAAREGSAAYGLIGQELLLDFNITYHLPAGQVLLEPRP